MPSLPTHCIGCGKPMRARVACPQCELTLCSEVCARRHARFSHAGNRNLFNGWARFFALFLLALVIVVVFKLSDKGESSKDELQRLRKQEQQQSAEQEKARQVQAEKRHALEKRLVAEDEKLRDLTLKQQAVEARLKATEANMKDIEESGLTGGALRDAMEPHRNTFQETMRESEVLQQSIAQQQAKVDDFKRQLNALPK